jgi:hypothetical protein
VPYVKGVPSADVMCVGVTDYYKQEFLKGVAQGEAGGTGGPLQTMRHANIL